MASAGAGRRNPDWVRDELVLACDLLASNDWTPLDNSHPKVIELSKLIASLPLHPTGGVVRTSIRRKLSNLRSQHPEFTGSPTNGSKLDKEVVEQFVKRPKEMHEYAEALRAGRFDGVPPPAVEYLDDFEAAEGRLLVRRHLARERDRKLRSKKIANRLAGGGRIACEVCDFDYERTYGELGQGYIECHHVVPLSESGTTTTHLDQLALICANCHRMIHRSDPWLTPVELKALLVS